MTKSPYEHLLYFAEELKARPIGSRSNHLAGEYIERVFTEAGYTVETQSFECPTWDLCDVTVCHNGQQLRATANAFSAPCNVTATFEWLCTIEELEAADIRGKVAILYGDIVKEKFFPRAFTMFQPERHVRILQLLEAKQPAAIVVVYDTIGQQLSRITDWQFHIPTVTISPEDALPLLGSSSPIHIRIDAETSPGHSQNVIAKPRALLDGKRIVVCAHYDTHFESPGAMDNGAGISVLLSLAQQLGLESQTHHVEFIAFSGEEYAALGDTTYLANNPDLENIIVAINIDGVGQALGNTTVTAIGCTGEMEMRLKSIKASYPSSIWVEPWYESNHTTFVFQGVQAIALSSIGVRHLVDSPDDEMKWVSPQKLQEAEHLVRDIIEAFDEKAR